LSGGGAVRGGGFREGAGVEGADRRVCRAGWGRGERREEGALDRDMEGECADAEKAAVVEEGAHAFIDGVVVDGGGGVAGGLCEGGVDVLVEIDAGAGAAGKSTTEDAWRQVTEVEFRGDAGGEDGDGEVGAEPGEVAAERMLFQVHGCPVARWRW